MRAGEGRAGKAAEARIVAHHRGVEKAHAEALRRQLGNQLKRADHGEIREGRRAVALLRQLPLQNVARARALLAQDQTLAEQLLQRHLPPGEGMAAGADADVRLHAHAEAVVARLVEDALQHHKVQLARLQLAQQPRGVVHQKGQPVARRAQKPPNLRQQDVVADGFRRADAQQRLRPGVHRGDELFLVVAQRGRVLLQQLARPRFAQPPAAVVEQLCAVLRLQRLNVLAHRRLGEVQRLRRPAVVHRAAQGQKGLESGIHGCSLHSKEESIHSVQCLYFIINPA